MSAAGKESSPSVNHYLILLLGVGAFGFSGVFAHMSEAPGFVVAVWRVSVATLALTIPLLRQPPALRRLDRHTLTWGVIGGSVFALSLGVFHYALDYTGAANATFLGNVSPMWVGLITLFVLKQALPRLFWPGVAVALAGAALIVLGDGGLSGISRGDVIVLVNSIFWASYQVLTGQMRIRISALTWVWLVVAVASAWLLPLALLMGYRLTGYDAGSTWAMIAAGLVSQSGGFMAYNYALGYISAARVSVVNMLQPVVTAIAAYLLLAEPFGGWRLVGGALILAGVYLVTRPERAAQQTPAQGRASAGRLKAGK